ncbi:hypothetical protein HUJ05_007694 [Dendroctonus ponderosae]|nr:hypothetical protein HUJ05_007694 [Dendroctonus ponderosae]
MERDFREFLKLTTGGEEDHARGTNSAEFAVTQLIHNKEATECGASTPSPPHSATNSEKNTFVMVTPSLYDKVKFPKRNQLKNKFAENFLNSNKNDDLELRRYRHDDTTSRRYEHGSTSSYKRKEEARGPRSHQGKPHECPAHFVRAMSEWFGRSQMSDPQEQSQLAAAQLHDEARNWYGAPRVIISGNGTPFTSNAFQMLCREQEIQHRTTSVYHQWANPSEGRTQELKKVLRILLTGKPENQWGKYLTSALKRIHTWRDTSPTPGPSSVLTEEENTALAQIHAIRAQGRTKEPVLGQLSLAPNLQLAAKTVEELTKHMLKLDTVDTRKNLRLRAERKQAIEELESLAQRVEATNGNQESVGIPRAPELSKAPIVEAEPARSTNNSPIHQTASLEWYNASSSSTLFNFLQTAAWRDLLPNPVAIRGMNPKREGCFGYFT